MLHVKKEINGNVLQNYRMYERLQRKTDGFIKLYQQLENDRGNFGTHRE